MPSPSLCARLSTYQCVPPHIVLAPEVAVDDECFTEPAFLPPLVPAPEIQVDDDVERFTAVGSDLVSSTVDNVGDGPVFDDLGGPIFYKESFTELVIDAAPNSDPTDGTVFNTNLGDLAVAPVFDTELVPDHVAATGTKSGSKAELAVFDHEIGVPFTARIGAGFDNDPLFDEEPEELAVFDQGPDDFSLVYVDVVLTAPTVDTPVTCSPKCLHPAVDAEKTIVTSPLQEFKGIKEARGLELICMLLNTHCSSFGDFGELFLDDSGLLVPVHGIVTSFLVENRLVISDFVENNGFESKFWDPGLAESRAGLTWDPGSIEGLHYLGFANFATAYSHGLSIEGLQKFWDPGLLDDSKHREFISSPGSLFCTCEDGMVSGQPKPPWLMCDEVARKWVHQSKLISAEHWQPKCGGFC